MYAADRSCARPKTRVTVAGKARANRFSSTTMTRNAAAKPSSGENTRPWNVFSSPPTWITFQPAPATPAPTRLKISAWLELDGSPRYQVTRFHTMAAISAETTSVWVETSGGMMPLPTVVATAVPDRAPTKLRTPAISTARPGDSTRVATTVAIALAVSWKPLMKSKLSPRTRMSSRTNNSVLGVSSGIYVTRPSDSTSRWRLVRLPRASRLARARRAPARSTGDRCGARHGPSLELTRRGADGWARPARPPWIRSGGACHAFLSAMLLRTVATFSHLSVVSSSSW